MEGGGLDGGTGIEDVQESCPYLMNRSHPCHLDARWRA